MLRRSLPPSRQKAIKRVLVARRIKATGPSIQVVEVCLERAQYSCEVLGCMVGHRRGVDWSVHHRLPRRMGGSNNTALNLPSNLLIVCGSGTTGCHGWLESRRAEAYDAGFILRAGQVPARVPVSLAYGVVLLDDEGGWTVAS